MNYSCHPVFNGWKWLVKQPFSIHKDLVHYPIETTITKKDGQSDSRYVNVCNGYNSIYFHLLTTFPPSKTHQTKMPQKLVLAKEKFQCFFKSKKSCQTPKLYKKKVQKPEKEIKVGRFGPQSSRQL